MKQIKLSDHTVSQMNSYMFDTNVWIFIYGPIANNEEYKQKKYSGLLQDIIGRKASLYITSLILSEYINRVLRLGFFQWKRNTGNENAKFKDDYRPTPEFKQQLELVKAQVDDILKVAEKRPDDFNSTDMDVDKILSSMSENMDYNDSYIARNCEKNKMFLVSDDRDMAYAPYNINVISL